MTLLIVASVVIFAIIVGGIVTVTLNAKNTKAMAKPQTDIAIALRLLDRTLSADDALASLPQNLRKDIQTFVNQYYKELS